MAQNIMLAKNLDVPSISFEPVKKNALGGNVVYLKYAGATKMVIQTPVVSAPFGLSTFTDDKTGAVKYSLDMSFRGMEDDPKVKQLHDKMLELDAALIDEGVKNSKDWFGKKVSKEVVENFYRPLVKPAKDPSKYAPTMKFKIMTNRNGSVAVDAYNHQKESVDLTEVLMPGSRIQAIIECSSVWFVNKSMFGVSWRLVQVKVQKSDKIAGFSFVEDSDAEEEYEEETEEVYEEEDA